MYIFKKREIMYFVQTKRKQPNPMYLNKKELEYIF
jgi:hypothetical protein